MALTAIPLDFPIESVHAMPVTSVGPSEVGDNPNRPDSASDLVTALLLDYQMAREDDRAAQNVLSTMIGVAIALLGALTAALVGDYPLSREALALAPLLPLGAISYVVLVGSNTTMRSFYMRALEEELRARLFANTDLAILDGVKPMSAHEFVVSVSSGVRGRPALRIAYAVIMGAILTVFGGMTILIGYRVGGVYALLMLAVYTPLALILFVEGVTTGIAGRSVFQVEINRFKDDAYASIRRLGNLQSAEAGTRSLRSYLLFPRPGDLIKWAFVPLSAALGILLPGAFVDFSSRDLWALLVGWLAFEYLAYQARYQINDVRGLGHDLNHPMASSRMRLPVHRHRVRASVKATLAAVIMRIMMLVVTLIINPFGVREELGIAALAIFVIAIPYEYLRAREPKDPAATRRLAITIWIIVGAGYAIRVCLGLSLAGIKSPIILVMFAVSAWLFGIMFVTLTWVLEATSYLVKSKSGHYYYLIDQDREISKGRPKDDEFVPKIGLVEKPHVLHLLPFIKVDAEESSKPVVGGSDCSKVRYLESRPTFLNPWNSALLGAALSLIIACNFSSPSPGFDAIDNGMLAVTAAEFIMLSAMKSTPARWAVSVAGLVIILGLSIALSVSYRWPALLTLLIFAVLYTFFGGSSYDDVVSFNAKILEGLSLARRAVILLLVGRATFETMFSQAQDDADSAKATTRGDSESGQGRDNFE